MNDSPEDDRGRTPSKSLNDFATVVAGYVVGHGVLRLSASILVGWGDAPRAELLLRWLPAWNALGIFVLAWGLYRIILWLPLWMEAQPSRHAWNPQTLVPPPVEERDTGVQRAANSKIAQAAQVAAKGPDPDAEWKPRLKALQKRRDVPAILDMQQSLVKTWPKERAERLNRRLGRWYTKHFQRMMLNGRAAESAADVERVADHYADIEEFAYFQEILPVVRQCAELKQSLQDEE